MGIRTKAKKYLLKMLNKRQVDEMFELWENLYGSFDKTDYEKYTVRNLPSESSIYHGEIIKWAADISPKRVLFAGENNKTASRLKRIINAEDVCTTGLSDTDFIWNFEEAVPTIAEAFDLVISQAIIEHLLNPYKHVEDLSSLLKKNAHLIIHTVIPGFSYHRYPIDSVRFFPDWFEEVAKRLKLKIVKKRIKDTHIFYMYQRP